MRTSLIFIVVGVVMIALTGASKNSSKSVNTAFLAPPKDLKRFSLGYDESLADSIWLRVIQDIDFCDRRASGQVMQPGDTSKVASADEHRGDIPAGGWSVNDREKCRDQSWVFNMLDAVTTLAPRFRIPYSAGATILSVIVRDYGGATIIFERGVKEFPFDWPIAYKAAFHYLYDLGNQKRAAELLIQAAKNGGPEWLYSLAAKLYTSDGQAFLAKSVLQELLARDPNARFAKRLQQRLDEANAVLEKTAAGNSVLAPLVKPNSTSGRNGSP